MKTFDNKHSHKKRVPAVNPDPFGSGFTWTFDVFSGSDLEEVGDGGHMACTGAFPRIRDVISDLHKRHTNLRMQKQRRQSKRNQKQRFCEGRTTVERRDYIRISLIPFMTDEIRQESPQMILRSVLMNYRFCHEP